MTERSSAKVSSGRFNIEPAHELGGTVQDLSGSDHITRAINRWVPIVRT